MIFRYYPQIHFYIHFLNQNSRKKRRPLVAVSIHDYRKPQAITESNGVLVAQFYANL